MDQIATAPSADEPIGIIISMGAAPEPSPRFSAYVWGPVPDEPDTLTADSTRAA
jgi:hypothetical protein